MLARHPSRASNAGPQSENAARIPARQLSQSAQPGDARLSALHRDGLLAPSPLGLLPLDGAYAAVSSGITRLHSQVPLVVAGERCRSGASRARGYEPRTQDAASRSDSGSSPETPSLSGTRPI